MATIPLYNDGQMPRVPEVEGLSAVPQARYQVDYEKLGLLAAKAHEQPELPKDMFDAKGKLDAAEAWAGAVQQVGGVVKQLAGMALKAKDYADLHEGRGRIQETAANLSQWRSENPDTGKWTAETVNRTQGLQKHFSSQAYSPKVAVQLQQDVDQFRDQSAIENDVGAMEVNLGRARSAVDGKRQTAVDLGDMDMLADATSEGAEMGFYTADEAGVLFWEGQQRIFSKRRDGVVAESPQQVLKYAENPEGKEMPAEFAGLGQAAWRELKVKARESMYRHQRGLMGDFREAVQSNMVRDDADAEVWAEMHVPEGMRDATLRPLMHRVLHGEGVDMAEVNRIWTAIGSHDPKGPDAKGREERMRLLHMQFPAEVQEELDGMLDNRVKKGRPESMVMQAGRRYLRHLHDEQMFFDDEGKRLSYRTPASGNGSVGDKFDLETSNRSALRMMGLEHEMEGYLERRPEATPADLKQWLWRMTERELFLHEAEKADS